MPEKKLLLQEHQLCERGGYEVFELGLSILFGEAMVSGGHAFYDVIEDEASDTLESLKLFGHLVLVEVLEALKVDQANHMNKAATQTLQRHKRLLSDISQTQGFGN